MANKQLWAPLGSSANLLTTELNSLAANTLSAAGPTFDNTGNQDSSALIQLSFTYGTAPAAGDFLTLYLVGSIDGSTFGDVVDPIAVNCIVATVPVRAVNTAQVIVVPILIPAAAKFKPVLKNNSLTQAFAASGNTVKIVPSDPTLQN